MALSLLSLAVRHYRLVGKSMTYYPLGDFGSVAWDHAALEGPRASMLAWRCFSGCSLSFSR